MRLLILTLLLPVLPLHAQREIVISRPGDGLSVYEATGFAADAGNGRVFYDTLRRNLDLSGAFKEGAPSGAEFRLGGDAREAGGQLTATVQVMDGGNRRRFGKRFTVPADQAQMLGRQVADEILKEIKNQTGFATKRLVVVGNRPGVPGKDLYLVFPDGGNLIQMTRFGKVVLGPRWAPDGESITYTSFHRSFPDVVRHHLRTGQLERISSYPGMNAGGAISPDGRHTALILSRDGKPELYARDLRSGQLTRLTNTEMSAKSSPSWSPDGGRIVFVSGHEGRPHLYVISRSGGQPRRITTGGNENLSPDWGQNGWIAFTRRTGRTYQTAIIQPDGAGMRIISPEDFSCEDPSWAPNGRHIAATRHEGSQSSIYLLDTGGSAPIPLLRDRGSWYMPNWSP